MEMAFDFSPLFTWFERKCTVDWDQIRRLEFFFFFLADDSCIYDKSQNENRWNSLKKVGIKISFAGSYQCYGRRREMHFRWR